MKTATTDIRGASRQLRNDYEAPSGHQPIVTDIDHTVAPQHIIRPQGGQFAPGADPVRPQDHRVQNHSLNDSQGGRAEKVRPAKCATGRRCTPPRASSPENAT